MHSNLHPSQSKFHPTFARWWIQNNPVKWLHWTYERLLKLSRLIVDRQLLVLSLTKRKKHYIGERNPASFIEMKLNLYLRYNGWLPFFIFLIVKCVLKLFWLIFFQIFFIKILTASSSSSWYIFIVAFSSMTFLSFFGPPIDELRSFDFLSA